MQLFLEKEAGAFNTTVAFIWVRPAYVVNEKYSILFCMFVKLNKSFATLLRATDRGT